MTLEERVLDAFPAGQYALVAMLRLLEIRESTEVETAAVECTWQPRLLINPEFVARWANTPEKLFMLIMHELHHVLLGHTTLFPRLTSVDNLVFDAVINALLCRMFPGPEYTAMFTDFYPANRFPECLLRPASRWRPDKRAPVPPALTSKDLAPVRDVYRALYSETGADYHELYEVLTKTLASSETGGVPLLGDHRPDPDERKLPPDLMESVRNIVERWPQPPNPIRGRSFSSLLTDHRVQPRSVPSNRALLRDLLKKVGNGRRGTAGCVESSGTIDVLTPVPALDRRATVLRALGCTPMFYKHELNHTSRTGQERVHLYLDVSGSIGDLKSALYGAVLDTQEYVHPAVHLFSTQVVDVSLSDLQRGPCKTTGGTDILCVADHIRRHRVKRAVLVTDGFTGTPGRSAEAALNQTLLGVALTPGNHLRTDLAGVTDYWTVLNSEKK
jgi:hypothetical protein